VQLGDKLASYVTDAEKEQLTRKLQETEDWLYEDGENETKGCTSASWRSSRRWVPCY